MSDIQNNEVQQENIAVDQQQPQNDAAVAPEPVQQQPAEVTAPVVEQQPQPEEEKPAAAAEDAAAVAQDAAVPTENDESALDDLVVLPDALDTPLPQAINSFEERSNTYLNQSVYDCECLTIWTRRLQTNLAARRDVALFKLKHIFTQLRNGQDAVAEAINAVQLLIKNYQQQLQYAENTTLYRKEIANEPKALPPMPKEAQGDSSILALVALTQHNYDKHYDLQVLLKKLEDLLEELKNLKQPFNVVKPSAELKDVEKTSDNVIEALSTYQTYIHQFQQHIKDFTFLLHPKRRDVFAARKNVILAIVKFWQAHVTFSNLCNNNYNELKERDDIREKHLHKLVYLVTLAVQDFTEKQQESLLLTLNRQKQSVVQAQAWLEKQEIEAAEEEAQIIAEALRKAEAEAAEAEAKAAAEAAEQEAKQNAEQVAQENKLPDVPADETADLTEFVDAPAPAQDAAAAAEVADEPVADKAQVEEQKPAEISEEQAAAVAAAVAEPPVAVQASEQDEKEQEQAAAEISTISHDKRYPGLEIQANATIPLIESPLVSQSVTKPYLAALPSRATIKSLTFKAQHTPLAGPMPLDQTIVKMAIPDRERLVKTNEQLSTIAFTTTNFIHIYPALTDAEFQNASPEPPAQDELPLEVQIYPEVTNILDATILVAQQNATNPLVLSLKEHNLSFFKRNTAIDIPLDSAEQVLEWVQFVNEHNKFNFEQSEQGRLSL